MDVQKMVKRAEGDVDESLLKGTGTGGLLSSGYFKNGPLYDYLDSGEQVQYTLQNLTKGLIVVTEETKEAYTPDTDFRTALCVTDVRLLCVVGKSEGDDTFSVPLADCNEVEVSKGYIKNRISVQTESETYDMYVKKGPELDAIADYIITNSPADSESNISITGREKPRETARSGNTDSSVDARPPREATPEVNGGVLEDSVSTPTKGSSEPNDQDNEESETQRHHNTGRENKISPDEKISIEVLVTSIDDEPLGGATVALTGSTFDTDGETSATGRCQLSLPMVTSKVDLAISHPKYVTTKTEVAVSDGTVIDVALSPHSEDGSNESPDEAGREIEKNSTGATADVPREALSEELRRLDTRISGQVTRGKMRADGKFKPENYEAAFETWSDAVDAVLHDENPQETEEGDLSPSRTPQKKYSKDDVISAIVDVCKTVDGRPTTVQMNNHGIMSPAPAYRYFDSWSDAVDAAETRLEDNAGTPKEPEFSKDEVLKTIADIAAETDEWPRMTQFQAKTSMTNSVVFRHFDTWEEAASTAITEYDVEVSKGPQKASSGDNETDQASGDTEQAPTPAPEFDWVSSINDPLADPIEDVPEGRLSNVCVKIVQKQQIDRSSRQAVLEVKTPFEDLLKLTIWSKHNIAFDVLEGDILRLDQVRLKRWESEDGSKHALSSTRDLSFRVIESEQLDSGHPFANNGETDGPATPDPNRFKGVGGATNAESKTLVEAGYYSEEDLNEASMETLRSLDGLDDQTALRIKAEFG